MRRMRCSGHTVGRVGQDGPCPTRPFPWVPARASSGTRQGRTIRGGMRNTARVTATNTIVIEAPVEAVTAAIADYAGVRPRIQPEQFSAYRLIEGGQGQGTVAAWHLQATKKRSRDV